MFPNAGAEKIWGSAATSSGSMGRCGASEGEECA